jgi:ATP-dependent DNA helicase RecG
MTISDPVTTIKGVGEAVGEKLAEVGLHTVYDLIHYYPRSYDDYSHITAINALKPGTVTIIATIKQAAGHYVRGGLHITEAIASDETDSVRLIWFNQPYRAKALKPNTAYYIAGDFGLRRKRMSILNPSVELVSSFPVNTARIVPIYPLVKGLTSQMIRKALKEVLKTAKLEEYLPSKIIKENHLMPLKEAVYEVHFPSSSEKLAQARFRLGFEEVFMLILASLLNKQEVELEHSLAIPFDEKIAKDFVKHLPFKLTDSQRKAVWQIYQDIDKTHPMNRLVEGDVGSGKTVVAAMAALMAMKEDFQVAFMAPTEILARQHADTLYELLKSLNMESSVNLMVGSLKAAQKKTAQKHAQTGQAKLLVGTHALIQSGVDMKNLGLVIIDEQHRFGTEQRKELIAKAGHMPHVLSMTATPIPRSLALTLYGELDISVLGEKPGNRKPIKTEIIRAADRIKLYKTIDKELEKGYQAFVVSPLIEASGKIEARSTEEVMMDMQKAFPHRSIGLLHGKMKSEQKQSTMEDFIAKKLDILISTTVIEVGVDVPNASVMLIESPERFGLAQIHQLRGRVGRGDHQAYCYLLLSDNKPASKRLKAIESTNDGFKLAELDLEIRGPGALFGTHQHGALDLRIAKLTDVKLIAQAREAAKAYIKTKPNLIQYPLVHERVNRLRAVVHLN